MQHTTKHNAQPCKCSHALAGKSKSLAIANCDVSGELKKKKQDGRFRHLFFVITSASQSSPYQQRTSHEREDLKPCSMLNGYGCDCHNIVVLDANTKRQRNGRESIKEVWFDQRVIVRFMTVFEMYEVNRLLGVEKQSTEKRALSMREYTFWAR